MSEPTTRAFVAALLFSASCLTCQAVVDSPAPEVRFTSTLNAPAEITTLADLRGSAVLVELWGTWCGPCKAVMPKVKAWHEKYRDRGLVVVGIPINEAEGVVAPYVTKNGIEHVIAFDAGAMKAWGARGVPHSYLLDVDGTIVWAGHPATLPEAELDTVVRDARPFVARLTGQLEPVQALLSADKPGRAHAMLGTMLQSGKLEPAAKTAAETTIARLDAQVQRIVTETAQLRADRRTFAAADRLLAAATSFAGNAHGKALEALVKQLAAAEGGAEALDLARRAQAADALLAKGELDAAEREYRALIEAADADAKAAGRHGQRRVTARRSAK